MRVLWISLLLVETITCAPYPDSMWYTTSSGDQDPLEKPGVGTGVSPSYYTGSYTAPGAGSFSGSGAQRLPGPSGSSSYSFRPASGAVGFGSGSQQGGQSGSPGSYQQSAQGGGSSSSDGGDEEPDFTHVSPGDQVYARKVLSNYNKRNYKLFQQFYTETEPVTPQEPIYPYHGKTSGHGEGQFQKGF